MPIIKKETNELMHYDLSSFNHMLTTIDNPYNPFTQYESWYLFDTQKGYNTCNYLARIAITSDELSDLDQAQALDKAMDEIILYNVIGIYIKVTPDTFKDRSNDIKDLGI